MKITKTNEVDSYQTIVEFGLQELIILRQLKENIQDLTIRRVQCVRESGACEDYLDTHSALRVKWSEKYIQDIDKETMWELLENIQKISVFIDKLTEGIPSDTEIGKKLF